MLVPFPVFTLRVNLDQLWGQWHVEDMRVASGDGIQKVGLGFLDKNC